VVPRELISLRVKIVVSPWKTHDKILWGYDVKNWMPTVAAVISAAGSLVMFLQLGGFADFPKWAMGICLFAQAGGLTAFGIVTKQYNVTGGSVGQPSTPQALADANQHPSVVNPPIPAPVTIVIPAGQVPPKV